MSWALARARLVTIVEAATPTTKVLGLAAAFRHDTALDDDVVCAHRHFGLRVRAGRRFGPAQLQSTRASYDVDLLVDYPAAADRAGLDAAIVTDAEVISAALALQTSWGQPTSTIVAVGADSGSSSNAPLFPFAIADVDGGKRLRITFPCEVTA